ncbi:MAG: DUF5009 domain-containing protein [Gemmatimonadota bacterium]|nr:DUF5009 domain-containing protein [Gemmatimonadota bacterium]
MSATVERPLTPFAGDPVPAFAPSPPAARERLLSLDVFRGLTIAGMLLVNNPGSWGAIYPPLEHAEWNGWTPTDLIFPFFLFIVGITTHLSLSSRRARGDDDAAIVKQILRRGALIVLFGLLINAFPFFTFGDVVGNPNPSFWDRIADRPHHLRYTGVLQRIGVAYTIAGLLTLRTTLKQQIVILAVLLYGYWFAMTLLPVPDSGILGALTLDTHERTLAAWLDRAIIGTRHTWTGSTTWDPEGPFSTIPAIGTAMLGVVAGRWIGAKRPLMERIAGLFAIGALAMTLGSMWAWSFPINKNLWTSSYVLFTAGMAAVALATCMWLIDVQRVTWWTKPWVVFGVNPIIAFVGSGIFARCIYSIFHVTRGGKSMSVQQAFYEAFLASWLAPKNASFAFALLIVGFFFVFLWILYRRNIVLKV